MTSVINMTAIYIANAIGLVFTLVLLHGNAWLLRNSGAEGKYVRRMLFILAFACIVDPFAYHFNGMSGAFAHSAIFISNALSQLAHLWIGVLWVCFMSKHVNLPETKLQKAFIRGICAGGTVLLLLNNLYPFIFSISDANIYSRGPLFWLYAALESALIIYSLILYYSARRRGEMLRFLSVGRTLFPLLCGCLLQLYFYGISVIFPFLTISVYGIISCLQNEAVYRDPLTGLYNKAFMDNTERSYFARKHPNFTVLMMDFNDFKSINDRFGHLVGNQALIASGKALHEIVGRSGNVIRYAGDEFIILLDTCRQDEIDSCIDAIHTAMRRISDDPACPYTLSVAIGYQTFDESYQSFDALLDKVDRLMYADKDKFYAAHPEIRRR